MFARLIDISLQNRKWIAGGALAVVLIGLYSAWFLPIDAVPDITNVQVVVSAQTGALDPARVETSVSYYIESELAGLPGVREVRSLSRSGLSQVVAVFEDGVDVFRARQQTAERLQSARANLPPGIEPEIGPLSTGLGEVYMYALTAKPGSALAARPEPERLQYLRSVQEFILKPFLKANTPNVAEIDTIGGYSREIVIELDPARLAPAGVTIEEITLRLETVGESFGGGYIERDGRQIVVRTEGTVQQLESIARMPIRLNAYGAPLRLGAVARVREGHAQRLGAATFNGHETVLGTVMMLLGANSRETALAARRALARAPLPDDVVATEVYSRDFLVNATIATVLKNLGEGAALVIVTLLLILGNFRAAALVSLAIPLSMLAAVTGMERFGVSANLMSLGAIDFGLLVDASVVLIENVLRRMEPLRVEELTFQDRALLVRDAAREVIAPVALGMFIIMAVYMPILGLTGIEGKMFRPMALTVLMALAASLLAAVLLMPALALTFLFSKKKPHKDPLLFALIRRAYIPLFHMAMKRRAQLLAGALALCALATLAFFQLGASFIPQLGEGDLLVSFVRNPAMGLTRSIELQRDAEQRLQTYGEIERVFARIGAPETASDPMGVYMADTFVILKKDRALWPERNGRRYTPDELRDALRKDLVARYPDQDISLSQPIEFRFNEILEGSRADVNLRIYGPDLEVLYDLQTRAERLLAGAPGAESVELDAITALRKGPALDVRIDYDKLAQYEAPLSAVNLALESAMSGRRIGVFSEQDRRFPVVLRLAEGLRNRPESIADIPVGLADGGVMPLRYVASFQERESVINIARNGARRYAAVAIYLNDPDALGFVRRAQELLKQKLDLPTGYYLEWGGQFKNLEKARLRLAIITPLALAIIFLLLLRGLGSLKQTALIFASIPFAASGGVIALFLTGTPFSVSASIGFIALSGIAILNAMVLVSFFNQLRDEGHPLLEAVHRGALIRLRPVSMTALVASLGFLPMALNTGAGAEVQRPLAIVVIGGLFTATTLTLLLLPALYAWIEGGGQGAGRSGEVASAKRAPANHNSN